MNEQPLPPLTHCRLCGAKLRILNVERTPVSGLPGHTQMTANMVCPDCGQTDGVSWNSLKPSSSFPPDDPLRQYVRGRQRPVYQNEDGSLDLAALIELVSSPVMGIISI